jgi:hypothetical protein
VSCQAGFPDRKLAIALSQSVYRMCLLKSIRNEGLGCVVSFGQVQHRAVGTRICATDTER